MRWKHFDSLYIFYRHRLIVESAFFRIQKLNPLNERSIVILYASYKYKPETFYTTILPKAAALCVREKDQFIVRMVNPENHCFIGRKPGPLKKVNAIRQKSTETCRVLRSFIKRRYWRRNGIYCFGKVESFKLEDVIHMIGIRFC